jgi:predicted AlkP superfamily pyrophosphatase or phosphodiesterase
MKNLLKSSIALLMLCGLIVAPLRSQNPIKILTSDHGPNAPGQQGKPYVILVSLDGFRYDYVSKYGAPNLSRIAARGASAPDGMIPSFPSVTFPNHYTLVTGLYPEHHGLVANTFYDPRRKASYISPHSDKSSDGSWYSGVPLWSLAETQGMRSACFFWPTSDAEIAGARPSYYLNYDGHVPDQQRIDQVMAWLRLPADQRPHFITLYYSEPDESGHDFGPESPQTADAVHYVDALIGTLTDDLMAQPLRVDVIVVADHGMATVDGPWINLDKYADLSEFKTDGSLLYPPNELTAEQAYLQLREANDKFAVYRRSAVPRRLHYSSNDRIGDPVVIPTGPYLIRAHAPPQQDRKQAPKPDPIGMHGYDPATMKEMRAIFFAAGPDIRPGVTVRPFENVDVYPLIAHILGLKIGAIDGRIEPLRKILQR